MIIALPGDPQRLRESAEELRTHADSAINSDYVRALLLDHAMLCEIHALDLETSMSRIAKSRRQLHPYHA